MSDKKTALEKFEDTYDWDDVTGDYDILKEIIVDRDEKLQEIEDIIDDIFRKEEIDEIWCSLREIRDILNP